MPIEQGKCKRDVVRGLLRLAGRRRAGLIDGQFEAVGHLIVSSRDPELRSPRLAVPAAELGEIAPRRLLHTVDEVVRGHRLAVEPFEVEIHRTAEGVGPEQGVLHADQFAALLVDGGGVEIVDLDIGVRPHRVRHRPGVFGKLATPEQAHVLHPLHVPRAHVRGELLVPKHGEPLFQAQLEPVAAGDAVACPVVEILVCDDRLDALEILVGCTLGAGEDALCVEYVEPFVLHRPHVEVVHRDDHVEIQVVLSPVTGFVPGHRTLEGRHGVGAPVDISRLGVDPQVHHPPRARGEGVAAAAQITGDQREQVAGFGKGILPDSQVPAVAECLLRHEVAVGKQHGVTRPVRDDRGPKPRHHIGPVQVPCDLPKPFRLALGAEVAR